MALVVPFSELNNQSVAIAVGKNASLGEMLKHLSPMGINVPDGFATTAEAFRVFLEENNLPEKLSALTKNLDVKDYVALKAAIGWLLTSVSFFFIRQLFFNLQSFLLYESNNSCPFSFLPLCSHGFSTIRIYRGSFTQ